MSDILQRLKNSVANLDTEGTQKACVEALESGISPYKAVSEGMARGMKIVGEKYEAGEYFLSELIMAAEVMKDGMKILEPHLKAEDMKIIGKVAIGTVKGDLHDVGKNLVATLLEAAGFEVTDLGVDVPAEKFIGAIREREPDILAMSTLLTTTMTGMDAVINETERTGLRRKVKIIIGGAPITPEYAKKIGADAAAKDAVEAVNICKKWMEQ
jgi:5-methyltetrahydrofolate--homocysteine methyltransferase